MKNKSFLIYLILSIFLFGSYSIGDEFKFEASEIEVKDLTTSELKYPSSPNIYMISSTGVVSFEVIWSIRCSTIGLSIIFSRGFGQVKVKGLSLVPFPAIGINIFI